VETQLERSIGEAFFTCEQIDDLCQEFSKFHASLLRLGQRGPLYCCTSVPGSPF
jgi:hypothetical protein